MRGLGAFGRNLIKSQAQSRIRSAASLATA